jgi:hypothetical protein
MLTAIYILVVSLLFILCAFIIIISYRDFLIPQFLFFGFCIISFSSVLYIEINRVFIFEQGIYTKHNYSTLILSILFFIHSIGILLYSLIFLNKKVNISTKVFTYRLGPINITKLLIILFPIFLLILCYLNIIISGKIPLFSSGYIDRFEYIKETKFWPLLGIFGVTTSIIPILLSFGFFLNFRLRALSFLTFALYIIYIILIGHKFGGILHGFVYFFLPIIVVDISEKGLKTFLQKKMKWAFLSIISIGFIVFYHYSNYDLANKFGGALNFMLYRIFSLQGHTFWGITNEFDLYQKTVAPQLDLLMDGMPNMMRIIGIPGIEDAIKRGVNFTFGYFSAIPYFTGAFGIIYLVLLSFLFCFFSDLVVRSIKQKEIILYFITINLFWMFFSFMGSGTLGIVFSPKFFLLLLIGIILILVKLRFKRIIIYNRITTK